MSLKLKRISAAIAAAALLLVIFLPGCDNNPLQPSGGTVSEAPKNTFPVLNERTAWNIEIIAKEECHLGDKSLKLEIKDNDNQGFTIWDGCKIEHLNDGKWVELEQEDNLLFDTARVFPENLINYTAPAYVFLRFLKKK